MKLQIVVAYISFFAVNSVITVDVVAMHFSDAGRATVSSESDIASNLWNTIKQEALPLGCQQIDVDTLYIPPNNFTTLVSNVAIKLSKQFSLDCLNHPSNTLNKVLKFENPDLVHALPQEIGKTVFG